MERNHNNAKELKIMLKEAGVYDPSMTYNEMLEISQVLKDSENTASEEEAHRHSLIVGSNQNENQAGTSHAPPQKRKRTLSNSSSINSSQQTKEILSQSLFSDTSEEEESEEQCSFIPPKQESINVTHKRIYAPPFYCDPLFQQLDSITRAKHIFQYHLESLVPYRKKMRASLFPAPWDKPIESHSGHHDSLVKNEKSVTNSAFEFTEDPLEGIAEEAYVSRSGRVTKRKLYDDQLSDNEFEDIKIPKNEKEESPYEPKLKTGKKRNYLGMKNEDIMKRSKLFNTSSRSEMMFDQLRVDEEAKMAEENKVQEFEESLVTNDDDDDDKDDVAALIHAEEPFIRRGQKKSPKSQNKTEKPAETGRTMRPRQKSVAKSPTNYTPLIVTPRKTRTCLVCSKRIPDSEFNDHLKACGIHHSFENRRQTTIPSNTIVCSSCKTLFSVGPKFEKHILECFKNQSKEKDKEDQ